MRIALLIISFLSLPLAACAQVSVDGAASDVPRVAEEPKPDTARPDGVLKELYTSYFATLNADGKADMNDYAARYFEPELASKFAAAMNSVANPISFDIFINAQDHEDLTLGTLKRTLENGDHAIYEVHFTNNDDEQKVRIGLVKAGGAWKITDIDYGLGVSLTGLLSKPPAQ